MRIGGAREHFGAIRLAVGRYETKRLVGRELRGGHGLAVSSVRLLSANGRQMMVHTLAGEGDTYRCWP